jgi:NHL repeat.
MLKYYDKKILKVNILNMMSIIIPTNNTKLKLPNVWQKIADELLINIISFLVCEYTYICKRICKFWFNSLKSNMSKKILIQVPKKISFSKSYKTNYISRRIVRIKDYIYVISKFDVCKYNIKSSKLIKENNISLENLISSNDNYVCTLSACNKNVNIYSLNMEFINMIKTDYIYDLTIDDNNKILISTCDKFYIYNLKGDLINFWNLEENTNKTQLSRKIAIDKSEIYMVDTSFNRICVFSYEGKLVRSWGNFGDNAGNFRYPWGIAIYKGIVFVVDSRNDRIQVFTPHGKFIFEYKYKGAKDMADIKIVNDYAYVNDWFYEHFLKLRLVY